MERNFEILGGIRLQVDSLDLDLHNDYAFQEVRYTLAQREVSLHWVRRERPWLPTTTPRTVVIEYSDVTEFRFLPRDPAKPHTEDDCLSYMGYWVDAGEISGVAWVNRLAEADPSSAAAMSFMSGAAIAVQAASARAIVQA